MQTSEVVQVLTHRCTRCHSTARASPMWTRRTCSRSSTRWSAKTISQHCSLFNLTKSPKIQFTWLSPTLTVRQANNHHVVVEPHKALGKDVGKAKPLMESIMIQWAWKENICEMAKLGKHDEMANVWKPWRPEICACTQPLVPSRSIARSDEKYIAEKCAGCTIHKCRI